MRYITEVQLPKRGNFEIYMHFSEQRLLQTGTRVQVMYRFIPWALLRVSSSLSTINSLYEIQYFRKNKNPASSVMNSSK